MNLALILEMVKNERAKQDNKWGEQNHHPDRWMNILGEEYGEACKANLEDNMTEYCEELIQVAAVAVAAIESLYRNSVRCKRCHGSGYYTIEQFGQHLFSCDLCNFHKDKGESDNE